MAFGLLLQLNGSGMAFQQKHLNMTELKLLRKLLGKLLFLRKKCRPILFK